MDFDYSPRVQDLQARLRAFMAEHVYPAEPAYWAEIQANSSACPSVVRQSTRRLTRSRGGSESASSAPTTTGTTRMAPSDSSACSTERSHGPVLHGRRALWAR